METGVLQDQTLIIGDVHLGGFGQVENEELESEFISLLEYASQNQMQIILLGDVFDYFMQYGVYLPDVSRNVINWFKSYHSHTGKSSLYITGNHDNWEFGAFSDAGFDPEPELRTLITTDNKCVKLFHGDGLKAPEMAYPRPLLHRVLRNPYFIKAFKALTNGPSGNTLMRWFSAISRITDRNDNSDAIKLDQFAERLIISDEADVVICGHHHQPKSLRFNNGVYLNCGAFFKDKTAVLYTNKDFHLVKWSGEQKQLLPFNTE